MARFKQKTSALVCVLWLFYAISASAQSEQQLDEDDCTRDRECARHYLQARTLSKSGQLADALEEYHAAFALQPVPTLLFNIARLNHKLGRLKEAGSAYEAYLRQDAGTESTLREKATEYLAQIRRQIEPPPPANSLPPIVSSPPKPQLIPLMPPPPVKPQRASTPVYKRWWLWTTVGAVAVGGMITIIVGTQVDLRPKPSEIIDLRGQL